MDSEAEKLKGLLTGALDERDADELETRLAVRPSLRRKLADLALEAERTQAGSPIRLRPTMPPASPSSPAHIEEGPLLGSGGMAMVRRGRQLKLDRSVAVKSLRPQFRSPPDVDRLLREARVTGRLEHPNIVPVHDIVSAEEGTPQVVLKLIEGHTWSKLMADAERVRELFGAQDLLVWNLEVLMAVCRALAFAHSRGVLHRDVKPQNVMVGPFGEVYLLDWGIALELGAEDGLDEVEDLSGTTGYMAPEQLGGDVGELGPWTDTYLLGATLYHVLTGRTPHSGIPIEVRLSQRGAPSAPPPLPDDIPAELRRITLAALEPDPDRRTAQPEDFRLSLAAFLQHRSALRLVERGHSEHHRAAEAEGREDDEGWDHASQAAELAYRASLEEWPECTEATEGLSQLAALRIEHALRRDDLRAAARVLAAYEDLPAELHTRVAAAEERAAADEARLRRLVTDADRRFGHRMRGILGAVFGLTWVVFWCVVAFVPPDDATVLVGFPLAFGLIGLGVIAARARQLLQNRINRTSMWVIVSGLVMTVVWCLGATWLGLDTSVIIVGMLLVSALFASSMACLMDPWGTVSAVGFGVAFLAACYEPAWMPWAVVGGNAVLLANQIVLNIARARRGFDALPKVGARRRD